MIALSFVPALLLRDFGVDYELGFLALAKDALDRDTLFAFFDSSLSYAQSSPIYLWITMAALKLMPTDPMPFILLFSLLPFLVILSVVDRFYASDYRHQERLLIILGVCSVHLLVVATTLARVDMLFAAVELLAYIKLMRRYQLLKEHQGAALRPKYGNIAIPLCLFIAVFITGIDAFIIVVLSLIITMALNRELSHFFEVFRPYYLVIMLLLSALVVGFIYLEGGSHYVSQFATKFLKEHNLITAIIGLFSSDNAALSAYSASSSLLLDGSSVALDQGLADAWSQGEVPIAQLFSLFLARGMDVSLGLKLFVMLNVPVGLCALYFFFKNLRRWGRLNLKIQSLLVFVILSMLTLLLPKVDHELYLIPAAPLLYYYVVLCYRHMQEQVMMKKISSSVVETLTAKINPHEIAASKLKRKEQVNAALNPNKDEEQSLVDSFDLDAQSSHDELSKDAKSSASDSKGSSVAHDEDGDLAEKKGADAEEKASSKPNLVLLDAFGNPDKSVKTQEQIEAEEREKEQERQRVAKEQAQEQAALEHTEKAISDLGNQVERLNNIGSKLEQVASSGSQAALHELARMQGHKRVGIEIVGAGYLLSAINMRSDRTKLPLLLVLALLIPLLGFIGAFGLYFYLYEQVPLLQHVMIGLGLGFIAFSSIIAILFLLSRLFLFALAVTGLGTLGLMFLVSFALPHLNSFVGVGNYARIISENIDHGAERTVCVVGANKQIPFELYDARIVVEQDEAKLSECLDKRYSIIVERNALLKYPELNKQLMDLGAYRMGRALVLFAPRAKPKENGFNHLEKSHPSSLFLPSSGSNLDEANNLKSKQDESVESAEAEALPKSLPLTLNLRSKDA